MHSEILKPVAVLAGWTMFMWLWLYATRLPAISKAKLETSKWYGGTGGALDGVLPEKVQWVSHNFNHLHESPTVFYATALAIAVMDGGNVQMNVVIAWAYVGLRIAHSIWQSTINHVPVRFVLYALSSFALMAQVLHTIIYAFHN